jgi:hypothetical protein
MTVNELYGYLMECCDHGFGDAMVVVCDKTYNPITDSDCICDAVRIEWKAGDSRVVLQTG